MSKQEPVAWRVHPFDYGIGQEGAYAMTMRPEQVKAWINKGWKVEALYHHPTPEAVQGLVEALEETQRDLTVLLGNIFASSKKDPRWDGMYDTVNKWIARNEAALAAYKEANK